MLTRYTLKSDGDSAMVGEISGGFGAGMGSNESVSHRPRMRQVRFTDAPLQRPGDGLSRAWRTGTIAPELSPAFAPAIAPELAPAPREPARVGREGGEQRQLWDAVLA